MVNNAVIFEKDLQSLEVILSYLSEYSEITVDKTFSDNDKGLEYVKNTHPKVVLFSDNDDKENSLKLIRNLSDTGTNVIVISEDCGASNIIQALRYGAKDVISKPILKKELLVALFKCIHDDIKISKKSRIFSVFSNKGGVGKTVIAVNLAVELAKLTRDKVALVDLNLPIGDVTTFLDIKPSVDISEIVNNTNSDNDEYLLRACQKYKDTDLYVLAEPPYIKQTRNLTVNQVEKLFNKLRNLFSYVVIDMGTNVDNLNMSILGNSDAILLVTIVNLPLIRNCSRCLDLFGNLEFPPSKTKIIINRYLENDEIAIEDVEKTLNKQVYWKIPNNYYTIMSSINKGIPVSAVNEDSNITESFANFATKLAEDLYETR